MRARACGLVPLDIQRSRQDPPGPIPAAPPDPPTSTASTPGSQLEGERGFLEGPPLSIMDPYRTPIGPLTPIARPFKYSQLCPCRSGPGLRLDTFDTHRKRDALPQERSPGGNKTPAIMEQSKLMELAQQFPQVSVTIPAADLLSFGAAIVSDTMARYKAELEARIQAENEEKLLTAREVAALFNVCTKTVARWKKAGYLTAVPVGGILKYRRSECRRIIEEKGRP